MKSRTRAKPIAPRPKVASTRRGSQRRVPLHLFSALLLVVGFIGENLQPRLASGEPVQQRGAGLTQHQPQQLQQPLELVGLQESALPFAISATQALPLGSYTNTKRARKMSAFIPMRGRKDNRDLLMGNDSLRELIRLRLVAAPQGQQRSVAALTTDRMVNQQPSMVLMREYEPADPSLVHLTGERVMVPPQFFHQLQAHSLASRPAATFASREQLVEGDNSQREPMVSFNGGAGEQMMQAKLRRAFHPMRGKKAHASTEQPDELFTNIRQMIGDDADDNQAADEAEQL